MDIEQLKDILKIKRLRPEFMAEGLGIDISTWYRKLQCNGDKFTVKEMNLIIQRAKLTKEEAAEIFFKEKLAHKQAG